MHLLQHGFPRARRNAIVQTVSTAIHICILIPQHIECGDEKKIILGQKPSVPSAPDWRQKVTLRYDTMRIPGVPRSAIIVKSLHSAIHSAVNSNEDGRL